MSRFRSSAGAWVAAVGAVGLLIALFALDWYSAAAFESETFAPGEQPTGTSGQPSLFGRNASGETVVITFGEKEVGAWKGQELLGTFANLVMIAAAVAAFALALATATGRKASRLLTTLAAALAVAAVAMVALRIVFPAGNDPDLQAGIFVALGAALAIAAGRLLALRGGGEEPRPAPV